MNHARDAAQFIEKHVGLGGRNITKAFGDIESRAGFARRTLGVAEELPEFGLRVALGALGDVGGNGVGRVGDLLAEAEVASVAQQFVEAYGDFQRTLPDLKFLKRFVGHGGHST